jgi:hypothetical protein
MSEIHRAGARAPKAPQGSFIAPYRTILEDGSRYRTLGPNARLAFLSLKLLMPFANIERRASWPAEIADARESLIKSCTFAGDLLSWRGAQG